MTPGRPTKPISAAFAAMERRLEEELAKSSLSNRQERREKMAEAKDQLRENMVRAWLVRTGKGHYLDFSDEVKRKLFECFMSLDDDNSGSIGVAELEEPLIGLGFADKREDVEKMIMAVDDPDDPNGSIEFGEFLQIIKNSNKDTADGTSGEINEFFRQLAGNDVGLKN